VSQYLSFVVALVSYGAKHPEKLAAIWALIVQAYEAAHNLANALVEHFGDIQPREFGEVLTPDEEDAERQLAAIVGAPRGPFGNGKILRWLMSTPEGQRLRKKLQDLIDGIGTAPAN
jgi:hypothetical protein